LPDETGGHVFVDVVLDLVGAQSIGIIAVDLSVLVPVVIRPELGVVLRSESRTTCQVPVDLCGAVVWGLRRVV
jgi:hypothetical protein